MKKSVKILAIIVIYVSLALVNSRVFGAEIGTTNEVTRLRKEASTKSDVIEVISKKEKVKIIEKDGEWYKVEYNKGQKTYTGYIREDLLEVEEDEGETNIEEPEKEENEAEENDSDESIDENEEIDEESNEEKEESKSIDRIEVKENDKITVNNNIDIRILPRINSLKIDTVKTETEITVIEIVGKWGYIEAENQSGWVMLSKLEKVEENTNSVDNNENNDSQKEDEDVNTTQKEDESTTTSSKKEEEETSANTADTKMYVNTTTVNVREKADTNSKILKQLDMNTEVILVEEVDNTWTKIKYSGTTGYVATRYLSKEKTETSSRGNDEPRTPIKDETKTESSNVQSSNNTTGVSSDTTNSENSNVIQNDTTKLDSSNVESNNSSNSDNNSSSNTTSSNSNKVTGEDIVAYAKKFLGCKYVYGTAGPDTFDCSGFTSYVYKHFGYTLNRTSTDQRSNGTVVEKSKLQPGDIVCFSGHVGIYIGDNKFIHAANPQKGVIITPMSDSYYVSNYITSRRIL